MLSRNQDPRPNEAKPPFVPVEPAISLPFRKSRKVADLLSSFETYMLTVTIILFAEDVGVMVAVIGVTST
jgi:hypothetical protein